MKTLITITIGVGVLVLLFVLMPFTVSIPADILSFFTSAPVQDFFSTLYYFLPLDYLFACILIVYVVKYSNIFLRMITWIYDKIFR